MTHQFFRGTLGSELWNATTIFPFPYPYTHIRFPDAQVTAAAPEASPWNYPSPQDLTSKLIHQVDRVSQLPLWQRETQLVPSGALNAKVGPESMLLPLAALSMMLTGHKIYLSYIKGERSCVNEFALAFNLALFGSEASLPTPLLPKVPIPGILDRLIDETRPSDTLDAALHADFARFHSRLVLQSQFWLTLLPLGNFHVPDQAAWFQPLNIAGKRYPIRTFLSASSPQSQPTSPAPATPATPATPASKPQISQQPIEKTTKQKRKRKSKKGWVQRLTLGLFGSDIGPKSGSSDDDDSDCQAQTADGDDKAKPDQQKIQRDKGKPRANLPTNKLPTKEPVPDPKENEEEAESMVALRDQVDKWTPANYCSTMMIYLTHLILWTALYRTVGFDPSQSHPVASEEHDKGGSEHQFTTGTTATTTTTTTTAVDIGDEDTPIVDVEGTSTPSSFTDYSTGPSPQGNAAPTPAPLRRFPTKSAFFREFNHHLICCIKTFLPFTGVDPGVLKRVLKRDADPLLKVLWNDGDPTAEMAATLGTATDAPTAGTPADSTSLSADITSCPRLPPPVLHGQPLPPLPETILSAFFGYSTQLPPLLPPVIMSSNPLAALVRQLDTSAMMSRRNEEAAKPHPLVYRRSTDPNCKGLAELFSPPSSGSPLVTTEPKNSLPDILNQDAKKIARYQKEEAHRILASKAWGYEALCLEYFLWFPAIYPIMMEYQESVLDPKPNANGVSTTDPTAGAKAELAVLEEELGDIPFVDYNTAQVKKRSDALRKAYPNFRRIIPMYWPFQGLGYSLFHESLIYALSTKPVDLAPTFTLDEFKTMPLDVFATQFHMAAARAANTWVYMHPVSPAERELNAPLPFDFLSFPDVVESIEDSPRVASSLQTSSGCFLGASPRSDVSLIPYKPKPKPKPKPSPNPNPDPDLSPSADTLGPDAIANTEEEDPDDPFDRPIYYFQAINAISWPNFYSNLFRESSVDDYMALISGLSIPDPDADDGTEIPLIYPSQRWFGQDSETFSASPAQYCPSATEFPGPFRWTVSFSPTTTQVQVLAMALLRRTSAPVLRLLILNIQNKEEVFKEFSYVVSTQVNHRSPPSSAPPTYQLNLLDICSIAQTQTYAEDVVETIRQYIN